MDYLQELIAINSLHVSAWSNGFRSDDGYCIDRFGREIQFAKPEEIDANVHKLIEIFSSEFKSANDLALLSRAFARFYYGFIAIHPFEDGNHRTACIFLQKRADEKSYEITSLNILKKILLEGDVQTEMQKIIMAFKIVLKPKFQGA